MKKLFSRIGAIGMNLGLKGKLALVTGASKGIGEGVVRGLISEGARVITVARKSEAYSKLKKEFGPEFLVPFEIDLLEKNSVSNLIASMISANLFPDVIVNNVGGTLDVTNPLSAYSDYELVYRFNFGIALDINNAFIPRMQERKWGRICHVSSISALENQGPPSYSAAKAALNAYVRGVSRYIAQDNVILNSIMPGAIYTEGGYWDLVSKERPEHLEKYLAERMATKRLGNISEVTNLILFLVSEHASFMVGSNVLADGGQGKVITQD